MPPRELATRLCPELADALTFKPLTHFMTRQRMLGVGKLQTSYQDTSLKIWLADVSEGNEKRVISGMADISGMTEVYALRASNGAPTITRCGAALNSCGDMAGFPRKFTDILNTALLSPVRVASACCSKTFPVTTAPEYGAVAVTSLRSPTG